MDDKTAGSSVVTKYDHKTNKTMKEFLGPVMEEEKKNDNYIDVNQKEMYHALPKKIKKIEMNYAERMTRYKEYSPVSFDHMDHTKVVCEKCHHKARNVNNIKRCSADGCHDILGANKKQKRNARSLFFAVHNQAIDNSCLGCHMNTEMGKKNDTPTKCKECH